jgi:hypothetical protein
LEEARRFHAEESGKLKDYMQTSLFATPRRGVRKEDCIFYHVCDLPGAGQVGGDWDLRDTVEEYLGHCKFAGKTVLDVGTASGFLTFEMEKRGADVVSFDVEHGNLIELVPFHNDPCGCEELIAAQEIWWDKLKNAYWFCHERIGSSARALYGNIYRIPAVAGTFDMVMAGMCLPHLRDPLGAMVSIAARAKNTVIITQQTLCEERPIMQMIATPDPPDIEHLRYAWWLLSDGCVANFMAILGFRLQERYRAKHKCLAYDIPRYEECTTFVFDRRP